MKIICSCGTEIPLYKIEDVVFERDKYNSLVFPGIECASCGRVYALKIEVEHIGTNSKQ